MKKKQQCPICKTEQPFSSRYPKYLCGNCADRTTNSRGRAIAFYNTTLLGQGCAGEYIDSQEPYESTVCFVDRIPRKAEECHFGGNLVQVV